jgi:hypothetical protein
MEFTAILYRSALTAGVLTESHLKVSFTLPPTPYLM